MPTRNQEVTNEWTLIATGPVKYISLDDSKQAKYSAAQIAISASVPETNLVGHPVSARTGVELVAGENLYARAVGNLALLIVTNTSTV